MNKLHRNEQILEKLKILCEIVESDKLHGYAKNKEFHDCLIELVEFYWADSSAIFPWTVSTKEKGFL